MLCRYHIITTWCFWEKNTQLKICIYVSVKFIFVYCVFCPLIQINLTPNLSSGRKESLYPKLCKRMQKELLHLSNFTSIKVHYHHLFWQSKNGNGFRGTVLSFVDFKHDISISFSKITIIVDISSLCSVALCFVLIEYYTLSCNSNLYMNRKIMNRRRRGSLFFAH